MSIPVWEIALSVALPMVVVVYFGYVIYHSRQGRWSSTSCERDLEANQPRFPNNDPAPSPWIAGQIQDHGLNQDVGGRHKQKTRGPRVNLPPTSIAAAIPPTVRKTRRTWRDYDTDNVLPGDPITPQIPSSSPPLPNPSAGPGPRSTRSHSSPLVTAVTDPPANVHPDTSRPRSRTMNHPRRGQSQRAEIVRDGAEVPQRSKRSLPRAPRRADATRDVEQIPVQVKWEDRLARDRELHRKIWDENRMREDDI